MDTVLPPDARAAVPPDSPIETTPELPPGPPPRPPLAGALTMAIFGYPVGGVLGLILWAIAIVFVRLAAPGAIPGRGVRTALASPLGLLLMLVASGIGSVLLTLLATLPSPRPRAEQLGWLRPALDGWQWLFAFLAAAGASAAGASASVLLQHLHVLKEIPDSSIVARLEAALRSAPLPLGILLALASGLFPGFSEELLFRGYVLRRLLRRLSPGLAIAIAACSFSLWHGQPARVLATLPFALWVGYLAWRSGSVLPGIAIHVWTNAAVSLIELGEPYRAGVRPHSPNGALLLGVVLGIVCVAIGFAGFEWRRRLRPPETREPGEASPPGPVT